MDELISCEQLTKRFRNLTAVDGLDLSVHEGDIFGFLGPNGAGKSTTLRMLVGLIRPSAGHIHVFGNDVWRNHAAALSKVGAMIETPSFYKYLSGRDNLRILARSGKRITDRDIDEALDTVGLLDRAKDKVRVYSQGMRQRLGIGLALIGKPRLVLLDEPTNGLDPQGMKEVRELIIRLRDDMGITVFISSHLLHEVEQICSRVGVVNKGRLLYCDEMKKLLRNGHTFHIKTDNTDRTLSVIKQMEWTVKDEPVDGYLTVSKADGNIGVLNKILVESGIMVSEITPSKTSLEELYLQIMAEDNA